MEQTRDTNPARTGGPIPKPWIEAIHAYVPGKSAGADGKPLVKLSANENPLGAGPKARAAIAEAIKGDAALYPDPDSKALRSAIATAHSLDASRVVCGTGSDELLNLAAQAYAGPGDEIIHVRYGFAVYDIATRRIGATPVVVPDSDYGTDIDAVLAAVTDRTRVIFVANPNNPTGSYASREEIARLHAGLRSDILLVLDQAYAEYMEAEYDDGGLELAKTANNVLLTRTFSKIHGLASERIGWATGAPSIIDMLNRIRGPFNVTSIGQAAAIAALSDIEHVAQSRALNTKGLVQLNEGLAKFGNQGVRVLPSKANFALVLFEGAVTAEQVHEEINRAGYVVRHLPGQGLPQALRITIGTKQQMDDIIAAIGRAFEGKGA